MDRHVSTGCEALDDLLGGGFLKRRVNLIYGLAGTGKTTLISQSSLNAYQEERDNQTFFYLDTETGWSEHRFAQLAKARGLDPEKVIERIPKPMQVRTIIEQRDLVVKKWSEMIDSKNYEPTLFSIDSFINFYQGRIVQTSPRYKVFEIQNMQGNLTAQTIRLQYLADTYDAPAILVSWPKSRVSHAFAEREQDKMAKADEITDVEVGLGAKDFDLLGGQRLSFVGKVILRLIVVNPQRHLCGAILEKHLERPTGLIAFYRLTDKGIEDVPEMKTMTVEEFFRQRAKTKK
ncbi:MAG: ATPase domain-containing protein [Candidatus Bathyarchaeia archaeon]